MQNDLRLKLVPFVKFSDAQIGYALRAAVEPADVTIGELTHRAADIVLMALCQSFTSKATRRQLASADDIRCIRGDLVEHQCRTNLST